RLPVLIKHEPRDLNVLGGGPGRPNVAGDKLEARLERGTPPALTIDEPKVTVVETVDVQRLQDPEDADRFYERRELLVLADCPVPVVGQDERDAHLLPVPAD